METANNRVTDSSSGSRTTTSRWTQICSCFWVPPGWCWWALTHDPLRDCYALLSLLVGLCSLPKLFLSLVPALQGWRWQVPDWGGVSLFSSCWTSAWVFCLTGFCLMTQLPHFHSFLFGFSLDSFRVEGRIQILRSPVAWFGALPFCLGLAGPSDPFCVSDEDFFELAWGKWWISWLCEPVKTPCCTVFNRLWIKGDSKFNGLKPWNRQHRKGSDQRAEFRWNYSSKQHFFSNMALNCGGL